MTVRATCILRSISSDGVEIATIQTRHPRMIHADFMTHRVFGRNARSSRAVPNKVLLSEPIVEPLFYGENQKGMTAGGVLSGWRYLLARATWLGMAHMTRLGVRVLQFAGLHKQWSNRPLEWFGCIDVLVTSTSWKNFEALRIHGAAQPEIQRLAALMRAAREMAPFQRLQPGEWHLPFITDEELNQHGGKTDPSGVLRKLSVARCARMTYQPFDGNGDMDSEMGRFKRLMVDRPVHASPAEHQATPDNIEKVGMWTQYENPELHGNLTGWIQYRKTIPNEFVPG